MLRRGPLGGVGLDWSMDGIKIVSGLQEIDVTGSFDFQTGHQVALTDGATTLEHIVGPLQITSADRATDVVTGGGIHGIPENVDLGVKQLLGRPRRRRNMADHPALQRARRHRLADRAPGRTG